MCLHDESKSDEDEEKYCSDLILFGQLMVLTIRFLTFLAGLWAVWILQIIIKDNEEKVSHQCGI